MAAKHDIDLSNMSREELKALRSDIDKALSDYDARKRSEALAAVHEAAKQHGFKLDELVSGGAGRKKTVSVPKYANPENPSQTWTGRGRQPAWVKEALENGADLDDMLIGASDKQPEKQKKAA